MLNNELKFAISTSEINLDDILAFFESCIQFSHIEIQKKFRVRKTKQKLYIRNSKEIERKGYFHRPSDKDKLLHWYLCEFNKFS